MTNGSSIAKSTDWGCEVCILAGGRSSRMGRDKAHLRLGGKSLLARIRTTASRLGMPVRVIRRDLIPRCGPLGGIYTALKTSRTEALLFLSCDMPFVSERLLQEMLARVTPQAQALFMATNNGVGFPFLLKNETLAQVEQHCVRKRLSLRDLVRTLRAEVIQPTLSLPAELFNVNTPADWAQARQLWRRRRSLENKKVHS